ncbi:hypothetical protein [Helicobacter zhangjianzhongii]|uniref:Uncharacterized protein n=1 Tax=Helicobacter zhangjianzhongii TaxID=2974574 RepID=A0ACC6FQN6_9HELI|nr:MULTISPECIES: hypothetical protein [unclassified Helicobacter]MDL0079526.1 hypothetical protein [Helicobacter sp. CPD2-1]MDL0081573.1 hypothetical protein [Helicobacter sp. XJK30-2]
MKWHYKTCTAAPLSLRDSALVESWQSTESTNHIKGANNEPNTA